MKRRCVRVRPVVGCSIVALAMGAAAPGWSACWSPTVLAALQDGARRGDHQFAPSSSFTYQGMVWWEGLPVTEVLDFRFVLFDAESGGFSTSDVIEACDVAMFDGRFAARLDFGWEAFAGGSRWLEIQVRRSGSDDPFIALTPRQALRLTPFAMFALDVRVNVSGERATEGHGLHAGDSTDAFAPGDGHRSVQPTGSDASRGFGFIGGVGPGGPGSPVGPGGRGSGDLARPGHPVIPGRGDGLGAVRPTSPGEPDGGGSWLLTGNAGTNPGTNFLGTTDNQAFEIRVNNRRALRIEPKNAGPNVIGGIAANSVLSNVVGATIAGGGSNQQPNSITGNSGTISGGRGNRADLLAAVGGGLNNQALSDRTTIGGGNGNIATGNFATIGGGNLNQTNDNFAVVAGGSENSAAGKYAVVSGGRQNFTGGIDSTIGGGRQNRIISSFSTIGGGGGEFNSVIGSGPNLVHDDFGTIGGGSLNNVGLDDGNPQNQRFATIGGGTGNRAIGSTSTVGGGGANEAIGSGSVVAGGEVNVAQGGRATISGGRFNEARADFAVIAGGGGDESEVAQTGPNRVFDRHGVIGGGARNVAGTNNANPDDAIFATVGGGHANQATGLKSTVAGGDGNVASGNRAFVGGGEVNKATVFGAVVVGGLQNTASGDASFVGGGSANQATASSAFVGGGVTNLASGGLAAVVGGELNRSESSSSFIGAGRSNTVSGEEAVITGGFRNQTSGRRGFSGAGDSNTVTGENAAVVAGRNNIASGVGAFVPGGVANAARGASSFAGGNRAVTQNAHEGAFVWSGRVAPGVDFASTDPGQFLIDAPGGVGIGTSAPQADLHIRGAGGLGSMLITPSNANTNSEIFLAEQQSKSFGMILRYEGNLNQFQIIAQSNFTESTPLLSIARATAPRVGIGRTAATNVLEVQGNASKTTAGDWLANSDRRIKTDIESISDALSTLDRVRLTSFRYTPEYRLTRPEIEDRRYLNVIAQEFATVFPEHVKSSGESLPDGSEILQVDAYPLTIYSAAAIQELHAMVREQARRLLAGETSLTEVRREQVLAAESIRTLRSEVESLRARNAELESRLSRLEAMMSTLPREE